MSAPAGEGAQGKCADFVADPLAGLNDLTRVAIHPIKVGELCDAIAAGCGDVICGLFAIPKIHRPCSFRLYPAAKRAMNGLIVAIQMGGEQFGNPGLAAAKHGA